MSSTYRFEDPFRPIYEKYAVGTWLAAAVVLIFSASLSPFSGNPFYALAAVACAMAVVRAVPGWRLYRKRQRLAGHELAFIDVHTLKRKMDARPDSIFLGYGFTWSQSERQMLHDITRADPEKIAPRDDNTLGCRWLHGVGKSEEDLYIPIDHNSSHTLLAATTRAIKTRFMELLIAQAILRGEACIVIDPKGDSDLFKSMRKIYTMMGKEKDFIFFHPAHSAISHRLDPLMNYSRSTGLATRIATLIPSETGADPFAAFGQMALNNVVQGLLMVNEKPNLVLLRRSLEGGPTHLVRVACEALFDKRMPTWRSAISAYLRAGKGDNDENRAIAYIQFYRDEFQQNPKLASTEIEGLLSSFEHERTHFGKMIASLMPVLNMLTTGDLGRLLSPDHTDLADARPITDFGRVIDNAQGAYIGLDSLSDVMVGSAIGALMLADLTAVAGDRYNYGENLKPINLFVDEAAEVVNDPFIAMLNKAGGSKFRITVATQVLSDFAARVGNVDKAKMILGNLNNLVAGRLIDRDTQEYVCETFPKTMVRHLESSTRAGSGTDDLLKFSSAVGETLKETEVELFPPPLLGSMPNLEYIARISAGRVVKGRVPILKMQED
jgi:conjugal transfer pilus assembly protein TraD